jgi:hypothetical protein
MLTLDDDTLRQHRRGFEASARSLRSVTIVLIAPGADWRTRADGGDAA